MAKNKILRVGSKILRGEFPELFFRGREVLEKMGERRRASAGVYDYQRKKLPALFKDPNLLKHGLARNFRTRKVPRFFFNIERVNWMQKIPEFFPEETEKTIKTAEDILRDRYPIFGGKTLDFGSPPDWFFDPVSGRKSNPQFFADVPFLDAESVGDAKNIWEFSRLKFIYPLGQAYLLTGVDRYALKAFGILEDWFKNNPPKQGINWSSSLECSFRLYALIWMLEFFRDIELVDNRFLEMIYFYAYYLADHIKNHLSYYFSPNTHLTGEAFGLFVAGLYFPELRKSEDLMTLGLKILEEELNNQFTAEGVHSELSSYYHRYSADFYIHTILLCDLNNIPLPKTFREKTESMIEYMINLRRPDGLWPQLGDSDGGKLTWLDFADVRDYSPVLSNAALLFNKPEYNHGTSKYESAWLFGISACRDHDDRTLPDKKLKSKLYPGAGYAILRSEDKKKYFLFDCGKFGFRDCVHSHADALSFEMVVENQPVFIDPGTYCYSADIRMRDYFRSGSAHNLCLVDDCGTADMGGLFEWTYSADAIILDNLLAEKFDYISAVVNRKKNPVYTHSRSVLRIGDDYFIVYDQIEKNDNPNTRFLFHTPFPSHSFKAKSGQIILEASHHNVILRPMTDIDLELRGENGSRDPVSGWYSPDYGVLEKITTLVMESDEPAKIVIPFCIIPLGKKDKRPEFKKGDEGWWTIQFDKFLDYWKFGSNDSVVFLRKNKNHQTESFFIKNENLVKITGQKYMELSGSGSLYGLVSDNNLNLWGNFAGKCKMRKEGIGNIIINNNTIEMKHSGKFIEFEC